jgi:hypothetical protein
LWTWKGRVVARLALAKQRLEACQKAACNFSDERLQIAGYDCSVANIRGVITELRLVLHGYGVRYEVM